MDIRNMFLAAAWTMIICGSIYAQDRGAASSISWSPDGQTIAVASTTGLWLFDNEFNELGNLDLEPDIMSQERFVAWDSTGDYVVYSGPLITQISIVDVSKLKVITAIADTYTWGPVRWHPTADRIVSGTLSGIIRVWDAITGEELFYFDSMAEYPYDRLFHETLGLCWFSEKALIIISPQRIFVVDVDEGSKLEEFGPEPFGRRNVDCNSENRILSVDGRLFDLEAGSLSRDFLQFSELNYPVSLTTPAAVRWSPDSRRFVANLTGCLTRVYDGRTGKVIAGMPGGLRNLGTSPYFFIDSIAWHPDGGRFAVVGQFGDIRVWDAKTYELLQRFDGFELHPSVSARMEKSGKTGKELCP
ncbi:MAG: WD40 repeat domain-containing protein [Chloroflexi bacterium]|nr:WD40 repeat domain-containing protein [Chloroflexota bacterium]